jgi:hypothetical protein
MKSLILAIDQGTTSTRAIAFEAAPEGGLRLRPDLWADRGGIDGFYIARLRAPG